MEAAPRPAGQQPGVHAKRQRTGKGDQGVNTKICQQAPARASERGWLGGCPKISSKRIGSCMKTVPKQTCMRLARGQENPIWGHFRGNSGVGVVKPLGQMTVTIPEVSIIE